MAAAGSESVYRFIAMDMQEGWSSVLSAARWPPATAGHCLCRTAFCHDTLCILEAKELDR